MTTTKIIGPACIFVLLILTLISTTDSDIQAESEIEFMNGVSFVAPPRQFQDNPFTDVVGINANWVAVMPYAFLDDDNPNVRFNHDKQWWGERSEGTVETIEYAKQNKLKVLLKPHVWVKGQGWTGDFVLDSETSWLEWESSYENYILFFANMADSLEVDALCIGLEFKNVIEQRPDFWKDLIKKVRKVYHGKITYAANWDNYQNIQFWDKLDFIGINAYFPLSQLDTPSVADLKKAWSKEKLALRQLSKRYNKSIVFTEFGYRSMNKAAGNQWELEHLRRFKGDPNFEVQKNAYSSIFESFWNEDWFSGGFLWKWYPELPNTESMRNTDYTPQNKPAEIIIRSWYKKR